MYATMHIDQRSIKVFERLNQKKFQMMISKIKSLSVKDKEDFIRSFTLSPLYKYVSTIVAKSTVTYYNEFFNLELEKEDIIQICTFIELMNMLGWKNWKISLQEERIRKEALQKEPKRTRLN